MPTACGICVAMLTISAVGATGPAIAEGAGGVGTSGAPELSTVTGPPGTEAAALRYAAINAGARTSLIAIETEGGAIRDQKSLAGDWALPPVTVVGDPGGLSADGTTLVLVRPQYPNGSRTTFRILDVPQMRTRDEVKLRGRFVFDAISPNGLLMYLVHYPTPGNFSEYRVRAYDLAAGELRPGAVVDPEEAGERMSGEPFARAMSPDGRWAYTLYGGEETFVHALDTQEATAACIDLPQLTGANLLRLGLDVDPVSGALTVLERGDPTVMIDPRNFEVTPAAEAADADEASGSGLGWSAWAMYVATLGLSAGGLLLLLRRRRARRTEVRLEKALRIEEPVASPEDARDRQPVP